MSIPPMIKDLMKEPAYPEPPGKFELIQTHISFIILTDLFVYKIKKSLNFGFLDFSTLDKRRFYCNQELELNRRLSPDIYLDVVEIRKKNGRFIYDGEGEIVDYAVKMRRIPEKGMMITLLKEGKIDGNIIDMIAQTIAEFHKTAEADKQIAAYGSIAVIRGNAEENFKQTKKYIGETINKESCEKIKKYTYDFISNSSELFTKRMKEKKIRDCHGDIHMEHVCISDKVYIFDCIEFNERFRYGDVASDIAFLAMDLDFHGEHGLSERLIQSYMRASGDEDMMKLINFYKCYRAFVRGKVDSFELDDKDLNLKEKEAAREIARRYFDLALYYASKP